METQKSVILGAPALGQWDPWRLQHQDTSLIPGLAQCVKGSGAAIASAQVTAATQI